MGVVMDFLGYETYLKKWSNMDEKQLKAEYDLLISKINAISPRDINIKKSMMQVLEKLELFMESEKP